MAGPVLSAEELHYARELRAWRIRRRLSKKALAEATSYDPSRVSHIEAGRQPPTEEFTRQAEAALQTGGALWSCWEAIAAARFGLPRRPPERDLRTVEFVGWLAEHSPHSFQEIYAAVSTMVARIEASPPSIRHGDEHARRRTSRSEVAAATLRYYSDPADPARFYRAEVDGSVLQLTILTQPNWTTATVLGTDRERARLLPTSAPPLRMERLEVEAAVRRLAEVELGETVLVNNPLFRLVAIDIGSTGLDASFDLTSFAAYALTADLLEEELAAVLATSTAAGRASLADAMPLRAAYLPSTASALGLTERVCVGGVVALTAIARQPRAGQPDYLLLIQERSNAVLNVTGRLATIPKAFHQPIGEPGGEVAPSLTLERELEEELLGREDLEQLMGERGRRRVAPLHPGQASDPLAWLLARRTTTAFRTECTGFGINMVTGNYEFACLVVVDDEAWWNRFGHQVESNWEAHRVHCLSSLDSDGLGELALDPRWSNEGLFAFLQGLQRLAEIDTAGRVAAPAINLEM